MASAGVHLTNAATEISLAARRHRCSHVKVQDEADTTYHVGRLEADLGEQASLTRTWSRSARALSRSEITVRLAGRLAECRLSGLYALSGEQHADHHTVIDHAVPETKSFESYKGVLDGAVARRVHRHA